MTTCYRTLQRVVGSDPDAIVRAHASDALASIDQGMRAFVGMSSTSIGGSNAQTGESISAFGWK
jgi:hypothetical protein